MRQDQWTLCGFEPGAAQWIQESKFTNNMANTVVVSTIYLRGFNRQVLTVS